MNIKWELDSVGGEHRQWWVAYYNGQMVGRLWAVCLEHGATLPDGSTVDLKSGKRHGDHNIVWVGEWATDGNPGALFTGDQLIFKANQYQEAKMHVEQKIRKSFGFEDFGDA